jgi:hypothetical protein
MSALLNHNQMPYIKWKGVPFKQLTTTVSKNKNTNLSKDDHYFRPGPIKLYRREIATNVGQCTNSRISSRIDEFDRPNGYVMTQKGLTTGLVNVLDMGIPSSKQETNQCAQSCLSRNSAADNARRRCRSSGNIAKNFDSRRGDASYFTNSKQYLVSRSKTFSQNQYRHVRAPDQSIVTLNSLNTKTFSPNGLSHCPKAYFDGTNNPFSYTWVDGTTKTVNLPNGYYDVADLNRELQTVMTKSLHYLISNITHSYVYLIQFVYNSYANAVELQLYNTNTYPVGPSNGQYTVPTLAGGGGWSYVANVVPTFTVQNNAFQALIGFAAGSYTNANTKGFLSTTAHSLYPSHSIMTYKPSNSRFAQQGGVSSSSLVARLKYEAITNTAATFEAPLGKQVANAMSYGVSDNVYTIKTKMGYPGKRTPIISKTTGILSCVDKSPLCA